MTDDQKTIPAAEISLSGDRSVFLTRIGEAWLLRFKNGDRITTIGLSSDAFDALIALACNCDYWPVA